MELLRNVTELLSRTFPSQFVFPVVGHDDGTLNFGQLGELWRHWLPSEALQTFEKGETTRRNEEGEVTFWEGGSGGMGIAN